MVPDNIAHKSDGGQRVVGIADNWDHNEKTSDGKGTTHAMASILGEIEIHMLTCIDKGEDRLKGLYQKD